MEASQQPAQPPTPAGPVAPTAPQNPQQTQGPLPQPTAPDDVPALSEDRPSEDRAKSTDDLLRQILQQQQSHREEVASLREQIDAQRQQPAPTAAPATPLSPEDALAQRMEEIDKHGFYCPGCGRTYDYQQRCTGRPESGHAPIEVVSTDELKEGDESKYSKPEYAE